MLEILVAVFGHTVLVQCDQIGKVVYSLPPYGELDFCLNLLDFPCVYNGVETLVVEGRCDNDGDLGDDMHWDVCVFHCKINDSMLDVKYKLMGKLKPVVLQRHGRSTHAVMIQSQEHKASEAAKVVNTWNEDLYLAFVKKNLVAIFFLILAVGIEMGSLKLSLQTLALVYFMVTLRVEG